MRIVIVGAGVAGSIMARALGMQAGLEVTCLEQGAPADHAASSVGLALGPNAIKALHLRDPLQASAIGEAGLPWDRWRMSLCSGEVLADLPLACVADHGGVRILRAALHRVLRRAAGGSVRYGCRLAACGVSARDPARSYVMWEQDGRRGRIDDIDLLIAADGRASAVRPAFGGPPAAHHDGASPLSLFHLLAPDTGGGLIDDYEQWCNGPNRLRALRLPEGQVSIAGILPQPFASGNGRAVDALCAAYTPTQARPSPPVAWLLDTLRARADAIHWCRRQASGIRFAEPRAQVMYLGDSAHAMAPALGQGATQAIEDACAAAGLIAAALARGETDPRAWLARFEADRLQRMRLVMSAAPDAAGPIPSLTPGQDRAPLLAALRQLYCPAAAPQHRGAAA